MALETELKKIAINLQQLCDAIVTLTAELQSDKNTEPQHKPATSEIALPADDVPVTDASAPPPVNTKPPPKDDVAKVEQPREPAVDNQPEADQKTKVADNNVVNIAKNEAWTAESANAEMARIAQLIGADRSSLTNLFLRHNAMSMSHIVPENYQVVIDEARALIPGEQS